MSDALTYCGCRLSCRSCWLRSTPTSVCRFSPATSCSSILHSLRSLRSAPPSLSCSAIRSAARVRIGYSLAFTLAAAVVLASTRSWSQRVPQEALVGVIHVVAAAAAFLVVEKAPQGTEHIEQLLTGNILTTGARDLALVTPLYALVGFGLWAARVRLARSGEGPSRWLWDFFFYACFGVVVTSSVALAGVLLVFSFLIIPAAIGMLLRRRCAPASYWMGRRRAGKLRRAHGLVCLGPAHRERDGLRVRRDLGDCGHRCGHCALVTRQPLSCAALVESALRSVWPRRPHGSRSHHVKINRCSMRSSSCRRQCAKYICHAMSCRFIPTPTSMLSVTPGKPTGSMTRRRRAAGKASRCRIRRCDVSHLFCSRITKCAKVEFVKREVRARARTRVRWLLGAVLLMAACAVFPGAYSTRLTLFAALSGSNRKRFGQTCSAIGWHTCRQAGCDRHPSQSGLARTSRFHPVGT